MEKLSKREIEVLGLIAEGLINKEIGEKLFISKRTVESHRRNILDKLGARSSMGMVNMAYKNGILSKSEESLDGQIITIQNRNYILKLV